MKEQIPFLKRAAPAKRYYLLRSVMYAVLALGLIAFPFLLGEEIDEFGRIFLSFLIVCAFGASAWNLFKSRSADAEDIVISEAQIPDYYSEQEQSVYYLRMAKIGAVAWIILSVVNTFDIVELENTGSGSVMFGFMLPIYLKLGFWTAVLLPPISGLFVCGSLFRKGLKLKNAQEDFEMP